ncbi:MAG: tetratricopeptide repeat protein [Candidatus Limimorpha sp.]
MFEISYCIKDDEVLKNNHRIPLFIGCMTLLLLASGCSTKKNTITRRAYHNLTSHYNIYWNGERSLKEGDEQLRKSVKDDYSQVLRINNYGTSAEGMTLNSKMDRALEKTSICVQKHSMRFGRKERVKWIDDAYLVMGKAHFYKHDYIPAARTFDFVANEYSYNNIAYVANMWLIKTYVQTGQYPKAVALIEQLLSKTAGVSKLPKELNRNLDFTIADYYLAVKDYNNAAKYIKSGLANNADRDLRTRAMFVLGQIYMHQGDDERASVQFRKVIKRNPVYEMAFESRMNMARVGSADNSAELYKMLNKMFKDLKNQEYHDRIYYAMAELAMREGNIDKAVSYYRGSVASAKNNAIQRGISSLKVATILFDRNQYELAQAYYDTAVSAYTKETYVGYDSIMNISQTLNELVMHLTTVRDQDSLLRVAAMDSATRNAFIDKIIADVIEQERIQEQQRQYEEQLAMMGSAIGETNANTFDKGGGEGAWYFYNQATLSRGYTEFAKKWGMRKLEDNWRINDKRSIAQVVADNGSGGGQEGEMEKQNDSVKSYTNHDRGYYMADLPFTAEQKAVCHEQIADGLYNIGFIYMDKLSDYPRSIEAYESMITRYPGNEKELPSWYALYRMYKERNETEASDTYKTQILAKYPESSYAQFILDPEFFAKLKAQEHAASDFYSKTYDAYQKGQYYRVRANVEQAMHTYELDTALLPRFALLDALSTGRLETVDVMAAQLLDLVQTYPNSSVKPYALEVLQAVNKDYSLGMDLTTVTPQEGEKTEPEKEVPYTYNANAEHLVMVVCNAKQVRIDPLKVRISDFNKKEHRLRTFEIRSIMLDNERGMVSIGMFKNVQEAKDYVTSMFLTDYIFGGMNPSDFTVLPISRENYPIFYNEKDLDTYRGFWEQKSK